MVTILDGVGLIGRIVEINDVIIVVSNEIRDRVLWDGWNSTELGIHRNGMPLRSSFNQVTP